MNSRSRSRRSSKGDQKLDVVAGKEIAFGRPAYAEKGKRLAARLAGDVVGEIELRRWCRGPMRASSCETMSRRWRVRSKNRYGSSAALRRKRRSSERLSGFAGLPGLCVKECSSKQPESSSSKKEADLLNGEGAQQPVGDLGKHRVLIGFRTQLASELDQGEARVVTVAVEDPAVQLLLDPAADRLKDESRKRDQDDERRRRNLRVLKIRKISP